VINRGAIGGTNYGNATWELSHPTGSKGAILDCGLRIADLWFRFSLRLRLRPDRPLYQLKWLEFLKSKIRNPKSKITHGQNTLNPKSRIVTRDVIGLKTG